ncbi:MAG: hypothetical protein ACRDU8_02150, partial [Egibacteraceae bacterium]
DLLGLRGAEVAAEPIPAAAGLALELLLLVAGHALALVVADRLARARLDRRVVGAALFPFRAAVLVSLLAGVGVRLG